ncbi:MAG TPA: SusC/RagA family TonB-linked outer membrane protein [Chryseolinea sp.]|nr:SusC/RagA family TonB-linked outer membrane protein [Chryseolinea sp.]
MRKLASLLAVLVLSATLAFAQTRTITGQVKDSKGDPVPFANVTVKGTNQGVSADANGNFRIEIKEGESLLVSSTSFAEQEVKTGTQTTLIVTLQPQGNLQEVVVTALGIRRTRNQVPYAAQQLAGDEVSRARTSNFVQNLSGKVAGLDVRQTNTMGGSTNIVLRGTKSLIYDNQALFVVDGVPYNNANTNTADQKTGRGGFDYGNAAADINPDDIASVTVLKGAAASALYGSQGANGVILITTKKGAKGLGVTINSGLTVGKVDKSTFAKYQKQYGAGYGQFYGPTEDEWFNQFDVDGDGTPDLVAPMLEDASYGAPFDPSLLIYQWDAFDPTSPNYKKARPWVAAANDPTKFFETALSSNQSIYVDGGSDRGSFKLGYTRNDDKGILPNSKITKNLINFGATYNLTPKLTAGANINFSNVEGKGRYGTGYDDKNLMTNFRQWWEVNVDVKEQKEAYFRTRQNRTWNIKAADPFELAPNFWDNPYFSRYENYETDSRNRYFGNVNLNYKITDWLNILGRISLDSYDELQEERQAVGSVTTSAYRRFNRSYRETNYDLLINLDKNLGTEFNVKGLLGTNIRKQTTESIRASTNGGLIVPKVYALSNSLNTPTAPTEIVAPREVQGFFAGGTLTWREMVTLDATIRRDKSSTLPPGNNVYYYPSVSAGFVFSKLLPSATWLSYGKLRANYAEVGNDAPPLSVYDVYAVVPPFGSNPQSSVVGVKNNENLVPERTRSTELGVEMSFLKNRLGFDVTVYNSKSIDQIVPVVLSTSTGYTSKFLNAGTIQNKGIEVSLNVTPVQTTDFSWMMNVNWARNRNKVLKLFEGAENLVLGDFQAGVSLNATLGQPYGTIRGNNYVYTDNGKGVMEKTVSATTGRYLLSDNANEVIGNANAKWTGGVSNTLKYKNVSLSFLIDTKQGGDVFSLDLYYGLGTGLYSETVLLNDKGNPSRSSIADGGGIILPGVKPDGTPNDVRRANSEGTLGYRQPAAVGIFDASYVKLREVAITYSFPKKLISNWKVFKGIDISLVGRNLWIIDKNLPYADPEEAISSGNLLGYQSGAYPTTRTVTLNAKLRF